MTLAFVAVATAVAVALLMWVARRQRPAQSPPAPRKHRRPSQRLTKAQREAAAQQLRAEIDARRKVLQAENEAHRNANPNYFWDSH
jgi:hypothetical protein